MPRTACARKPAPAGVHIPGTLLLLALWFSTCGAGCAASTGGSAVDSPPPDLSLLQVSEVYLLRTSPDAADRFLGYLEERVDPADDRIYFVYGKNYERKLGGYLGNGRTWRYGWDGRREEIGNHDWQRSCAKLYGVEGELELRRPASRR